MRFHGESAVNFEPIASIFRKMTSANRPEREQAGLQFLRLTQPPLPAFA